MNQELRSKAVSFYIMGLKVPMNVNIQYQITEEMIEMYKAKYNGIYNCGPDWFIEKYKNVTEHNQVNYLMKKIADILEKSSSNSPFTEMNLYDIFFVTGQIIGTGEDLHSCYSEDLFLMMYEAFKFTL